jgi:hypothetical protein
MAITFVGAATQDVTGAGEDITLPTLLENDIVLIGGSNDFAFAGVAPNTTGYAELFNPSSNAPACGVWWKRMGATPDTVVNVDEWSSGHTAFVVMCFRGVDTTTAIDATTTNASGATGDPDAPSITTVTNGAAVVAWGFLDDDGITTCTLSTYDDVTFLATAASPLSSTMAAWLEIATAGAENPAAFVTDGDDEWHAATVALRPRLQAVAAASLSLLLTTIYG